MYKLPILLVFLLLVPGLGACGNWRGNSECTSHRDCDSKSQCVSGECSSQSGGTFCQDSINCPVGASCIGGVCEATSSSGGPCSSATDCPAGQYCQLADGVCVGCLIDDHCLAGEFCMENGECGDGTVPPEEENPNNGDDGQSGNNGDDTSDSSPGDNSGPSIPCTPDGTVESNCSDGIDNDCDGDPDSFDTDCPATDCGEPAQYLQTDQCNGDHPPVLGPRICEAAPYSNRVSGAREQCMETCRTRSECDEGMACFPARRSLNHHFCAPIWGDSLAEDGQVCTNDSDCRSSLCHESICREVCVRDADCGGGDAICRAVIRTPGFLGAEVATGVCVPRDPNLLPMGSPCTSGTSCQAGACGQAYINGPHVCSKLCGSRNDCGAAERCAPGIYDNSTQSGFGLRSCSDGPATAVAQIGEYCALPGDCISNFCDGSYYHNDGSLYLLSPYCTGHCDQDSDCPLLFPGTSELDFNLKMRCVVGSSDVILPLLGGYCAPWWCNSNADCGSGSACNIFNQAGVDGLPLGICK